LTFTGRTPSQSTGLCVPTRTQSPAKASLPDRWNEHAPIVASVLKAAARFWFVVTVVGQWVFTFAVAAFHGQLNADNSNFVEMLWKITAH